MTLLRSQTRLSVTFQSARSLLVCLLMVTGNFHVTSSHTHHHLCFARGFISRQTFGSKLHGTNQVSLSCNFLHSGRQVLKEAWRSRLEWKPALRSSCDRNPLVSSIMYYAAPYHCTNFPDTLSSCKVNVHNTTSTPRSTTITTRSRRSFMRACKHASAAKFINIFFLVFFPVLLVQSNFKRGCNRQRVQRSLAQLHTFSSNFVWFGNLFYIFAVTFISSFLHCPFLLRP